VEPEAPLQLELIVQPLVAEILLHKQPLEDYLAQAEKAQFAL